MKSDWTPDEDAILLDAQQRVGNKWSEIARGLPGRAENAVKNRFNSLITKRLTHGLEAQARRRDRQSESRGEADAAEAQPVWMGVLGVCLGITGSFFSTRAASRQT